MPCSSSLSFPRTWRGSSRLQDHSKWLIKEVGPLFTTKAFEPKYVPRQRGQITLGYYTNTKGKPQVQLPTKVASKGESHPMLETKKVSLWYQDKSCMCRGRNV